MNDAISFTAPGTPVGKERARVTRSADGKVRAFTPRQTVHFERAVGWAARVAMRGRPPLEGAVALKMTATFLPPSSWPDEKRRQALAGEIPHTSVPDLDNIAKAVLDGLAGVAFQNDRQVTHLEVTKKYGEMEGVMVMAGSAT